MELEAGTRLGSYDIVALLGAGGMGQVYRAHDPSLGRDVAIKILPPAFASDPERLTRFSLEARALAALNHAHIGAIYGLEEHKSDDGGPSIRALVLELVEGETLADRIARGPIAIPEALRLAGQIAGALEAAHDKGIVHRDLKPANVKVTPADAIKVLDFGLAKSVEASKADAATLLATECGIVVGTPAYMSPEQVRGQDVDKRADVWAFGCVLFEMLSARRVFAGQTSSDLVAAVLEHQPDWSRLPSATPEVVRTLLRRCLQKERSRRLRDIGDVRLALEDTAQSGLPAARNQVHKTSWALVAACSAAAAALAALAGWAIGRRVDVAPLPGMRLEVVPSEEHPLNINTTTAPLAISPDGNRLAYVSGTTVSGGPLIVRDLNDRATRLVLDETVRDPFFSRDGQWIGSYGTARGFTKTPIAGGTPVTIIANGFYRGASWADDHSIVFGTGDRETGVLRVSDAGGQQATITTPNRTAGEADHLYPFALPDGRGILFTIVPAGFDDPRVAVLDLKDNTQHVLIPGAVKAEYVVAGYLVYVARGTLAAVRFDLDALRITGEPLTLANDVAMGRSDGAYFAASRSGTIAYVSSAMVAGEPRALVWVDREGRETPLGAPDRPYASATVSPDGNRIAVTLNESSQDIWTLETGNPTLTPVAIGPSSDWMPIWTPDGRSLVFQSNRHGHPTLYRQAADGTGTAIRLATTTTVLVPGSIAPDGEHAFGNLFDGGWRLFRLPLNGTTAPKPLLDSSGNETGNFPAVSPNGRFVAYTWYLPGQPQVYVRPLPDASAGRWAISTAGGTSPIWSRDGRELFFLDASRRLTSARVDTTGDVLRWEPPTRILEKAYAFDSEGLHQFDVSPDGRRFLMMKATGARPPSARIVVLLNALVGR
jgi:serine/threonine-protein kinase